MRPIPGTITDPSRDRARQRQTEKEIAELYAEDSLTLDDYQEQAATTAVYPRVYTEDQVRGMLIRAYVRGDTSGSVTVELAEEWARYDLDHEETPFNRLVYPILGLVGEAGELANKLKKIARDDQGQMDLDKSEDIAQELGDVTWYVAAIATELRAKLGDIARSNIAKLRSRKERGVLGGDGDKR